MSQFPISTTPLFQCGGTEAVVEGGIDWDLTVQRCSASVYYPISVAALQRQRLLFLRKEVKVLLAKSNHRHGGALVDLTLLYSV